MIDKVLCYKVSYKCLKLLKEILKQESFGEQIRVIEDKKVLDNIDFKHEDYDSIFVHLDEDVNSLWFETFLKKVNSEKVNVILKNKSFDLLLLCQRYQVNYVFDGTLVKSSIKAALARNLILKNSQFIHLPVSEVMSLFSIPIKVKSDADLYQRLKNYFSKFESVKRFGILSFGEDQAKIGDKFDEKIITLLKSKNDLDRYFIGKAITVDETGSDIIIASPVYEREGGYTWMILELGKKRKDYVLNDYVYKFLQNTLIYRKNKEKEKTLEELSVTDEVTGLFNQRKLAADLEEAVKIHEEIHERFSVMFVDVDHFKKVNDNYGHLVGSKLLVDIGNALKMILRDSDDVYRYGGDEFVIIMPNVDVQMVHTIAGRISSQVKEIDFEIGDGRIHKLSLSIGIAEYPTDAKSAKEIVKFADEMMYISKKSGRGKVFHVKEV